MDSVLNQGTWLGMERGLAFRHSQHNLGGDRDPVPHRCQLWALPYNSAEPGVTLPALPTSVLKKEGEASPNHLRAVPHPQALTESMAQSVPARSRCTRALGWARKLYRAWEGRTRAGVIEPLHPQATRQRPQTLKPPDCASVGA